MAAASNRRPTKRTRAPLSSGGASSKLPKLSHKATSPKVKVAPSTSSAQAKPKLSSSKREPHRLRAGSGSARPAKALITDKKDSPLSSIKGALSGLTKKRDKNKGVAANSGSERRQRYQRAQTLAYLVRGLIVVIVLALVVLIGYLVLRNSSLLAITQVEIVPSEHVTEADINNLITVPEGSTLLNLDEKPIEEALRKNPWVASATFEKEFPHTLRIGVVERQPDALVVMASGSLAWYLGKGDVWVEPVRLTASEDESVSDAALRIAQERGCLLITDVPATVDPAAGSVATDETIKAVDTFRNTLSYDFLSQVASFSAPSPENISVVLKSGVTISLGSATSIPDKEAVASQVLADYPGEVTYINVRIPTRTGMSFRRVGSGHVKAGTGTKRSE